MSKSSRFVKLPFEIIHLIIKTEVDMEKFLLNQAQNWEMESNFDHLFRTQHEQNNWYMEGN